MNTRSFSLFARSVVALLLFIPSLGYPIDRSQCKQYGGTVNCWMPVIGPWKHGVCGEVGAFQTYTMAVCQAQGGTWGGSVVGCQGLPPVEYRRPTSEGDMRPFAEDIFTALTAPLCEGPVSQSFTWGGVYASVNCGNGNGPGFTLGYESSNTATPFAVTGKKLQSGVCNVNDTVTGFKGTRLRPVDCTSVKGGGDFSQTSGGTPALCNLGVRQPTDPKQECEGCKSSVRVGNPIDPHSGVKRQVELDYAGSGPQPLRFERVYNNRVYTRDGRQWRHNYSAHIENQEFGTVPVAVAHRPSGRVFLFKLVGADYLPDTDIDDRVTRLVDGGGALTGWQYYDAASDANELYDAEGKLLSITNRAGLAQTLAYSTGATPPAVAPSPGFLLKVTDAFGKELNFTYDLFGRMATMQDPAGQIYTYTSTTLNHFASVTYPDGKVRTYLYNEPAFITPTFSGQRNTYDGRLTGIVDENNSRLSSFYYDMFGIAWRTTRAGGADNHVVDPGNWPSSVTVTDPRGTLRTYGYVSVNGAYRNSFIRQPAVAGGTVQSNMTYTAQGNIATRVDFNGNRTNYNSYNSRNLETSRTEGLTSAGAITPATRVIDTDWHASFRLPIQIREKNSVFTVLRQTDMTYDGSGNLLTRSVTDGTSTRTWTYTYNGNGSVLTIDGPRTDVSDVTNYTYYANDDADPAKRGNLESITDGAGHVTSFTAYNLHGQPLTIVDPNGLTTTLVYDLRRRLTSRTVGSEITDYEYDGAGQLTKVTLPHGSFLSYTYDAAHRLTGMQDNLGNRISYTLDAMGNRTAEEVRDPGNNLAQTRSRVFNNLNRLFQEIGAASQTTQYAYDNQGNVTSVNGPLTGTGDTTSHLYDALNRMTRVTQPGGGQINYGYNVLDQLTSVSDPRSLATNYTVNALDNLTQQVSPDTGSTTNTHDAAGNIAIQTDAHGRSATYTHDAMNRVTQIVHAKSGLPNITVGFGYDAGTYGRGRLTSVTDPLGSVAFEYDGLGRVTRKTQTVGGSPVNFVVQYRYDTGGRLDKITYPSGREVTMGFDSVGRVASVAEGGNPVVAGATYFPFGPVSGFVLNGQAISRPFDTDGRPTGYSMPGETRVLAYDNASRITSNQRPDTTDPRTYGYDNLDRLTAHTAPSTSQSFGYDATGNRTSATFGGTSYTNTISGTSNRLSSVTASGFSRSFTYDPTGNTTVAAGNQAYNATYDARGRLIQMQVGAPTTAYIVNGLGQRVQKNGPFVPSGVNYFVYDEAGRLIGEYDTNGALIQETIYLNDVPVATIKPSGSFYIYADHLNTPRAITNASNQVVWRWELDPFGILPATENPSGLGTFEYNVRFPGQYFDKETNLHYNYFRDYDPGIGRYVQSDPIGLRAGINTYSYVGANPLLYADLFGLATIIGGSKNSREAMQQILNQLEQAIRAATCECPEKQKELQDLFDKWKIILSELNAPRSSDGTTGAETSGRSLQTTWYANTPITDARGAHEFVHIIPQNVNQQTLAESLTKNWENRSFEKEAIAISAMIMQGRSICSLLTSETLKPLPKPDPRSNFRKMFGF